MVTRGYYSEEEPIFRRYGPHGQIYPVAQERSEHTHVSRSYSDGRNGDHGSESIDTGHQMRRRIQVALHYSVKDVESARSDAAAKIMADHVTIARIPAQNHMTAMPLEQAKDHSPDCFDDASRSMYRIPSNAPFNTYYQTTQTVNLGPDSMNYRPPNYSNYGYQGNKFLTLSPYGDFTDEPAEFNLSNSTTFPVAAQDPVSVSNYPAQNNGRTRVNHPASMYMDSEANYNQNGYQSYNMRSMVDSDSKNFCITNTVAQTALNVTNGAERVLPYPSVNRQYRSSNDGNSSSQNSLQSYGFMNSNMNGSKHMNGSSIQMPLANPYMSVPASTSQEITTAAAEMAYNSSQQLSMTQSDPEMYNPTTPSSSLYYSQTNDSTADISRYGTSSGSGSSKRRQSSQATTDENAWSANNRKSSSSESSSERLLANGLPYEPSTVAHYPSPIIPPHMQSHGLLQQVHDGLPHPRDYISNLPSR
ncbi:hypothetical protein SBOR_5179 [Sclerotinia borealis F-4128]|uniref:Uncharacterized protein n=1 Tax=Sclerotinia borealis (strain F-4128) TaxID=1432307 RepID=W9CF19_SCLBF|nr:hypothetical protein SBOR_5179 [Sclerotinia borealis F-4128]